MSRSAETMRILLPALGGTAVVLGLSVVGADLFVTDAPVTDRAPGLRAEMTAASTPAPARAAPEDKDLGEAAGDLVLARLEVVNDAAGEAPSGDDAEAAASEPGDPADTADVAVSNDPDASAADGPAAEAVMRPTLASAGAAASEPSPVSARDGAYGLGREALPEEVSAWDIDVRPDGLGLPDGSGDVATGEGVYLDNCSTCHGDFGEAVGRWPVLMGGQGTLAKADPVKTVGSYWPYLSTVYDYVHRAMPFGNAQSLSDDEVYAVVAYVLYLNDLVDDDFVLSKDSFAQVEMPNADGFVPDDRPESELAAFSGEPCMSHCADGPVEVTARAQVIDVTPQDGERRRAVEVEAAESEEQSADMVEAAAEIGTDVGVGGAGDAPDAAIAADAPADQGTTADEAQAAADADAPEADTVTAQTDAAPDPELVAAGEKLFRRCASCHKIGEGAKNATGPHLNGILGRAVGGVEGFKYSTVFQEYHDEGRVWDADTLSAFIADPKGWAPGTKMSFRGLSKSEDQAAIVAYLTSEAE